MVGILEAVVALNLLIINQATWSWTTIIGPLIGAFVGVFLGFLINEFRRHALACRRKLFFRNLLLTENKKSIEIIEEGKYGLIPIDGWSSLLNSGDVALFKDVTAKLSKMYSKIHWYNNELKISRDAVEREFDLKLGREEKEKRRSDILRQYMELPTDNLLQMLFDTTKLLKEMEIESWWEIWK